MQTAGLTFTFSQEGFKLSDYMTRICDEDKIDVFYLSGCWSLVAKIDELMLKDGLSKHIVDGQVCYEINEVDTLRELYFLLLEEYYLARGACVNSNFPNYNGICSKYSQDTYVTVVRGCMTDLEWLLFFMTKRIATAQFFEALSPDSFFNGEVREQWLEMCENWGNATPTNFKIIFWIK